MSKRCKTQGCDKHVFDLGYCWSCCKGFGIITKKTQQHDRKELRVRSKKTLQHDSSIWNEPTTSRNPEVIHKTHSMKGWFRLGLVVSVIWAAITWFVLEPINYRGYVRDEEMLVVFGPLAIVLFMPAFRLTLGLFAIVKSWVSDGFRDSNENHATAKETKAPVLNSGSRLEQVRKILDFDCAYDLTPAGELIVDVHDDSYGPWDIASNIVVLAVAMERMLNCIE